MRAVARTRCPWRCIATAMLLVGATAVRAADTASERMEACRSLADDDARLACYDRIPLPRTVAQPPTPATQAEPPVVVAAEPDVQAPPAPPQPATTATMPEGEEGMVRRGLERLRSLFGRDEKPVEKPPELQSIEARVVKFVKQGLGHHRLTLEDGQVWHEIEVKRRARYQVGDTVVIARGVFGSYNLSSERTGHRVKVRRVR